MSREERRKKLKEEGIVEINSNSYNNIVNRSRENQKIASQHNSKLPTSIKSQVDNLYNKNNVQQNDMWERVKTRAQNIMNSTNYISQKFSGGIISGITGIGQSGITEFANNLKIGNEKKSNEIIQDVFSGLDSTINTTKMYTSLMKKSIEDNINILKNKDTNSLEKGVNTVTQTVSNAINSLPVKKQIDTVQQVVGKIANENASKEMLKLNEKISKPSEKINQMLAEESKKYGTITNYIGDAMQSVGNMGVSIGTTAITGNPAIGLGIMGISAKGQSTQEALNKGVNLQKAIDIGNTKGAIEIGTEMLTGGVNIFGKGALDEIVEKGIDKKVKNKVLKGLAHYGYDVTGEVIEETISDLLGTVIDKGTVDPNATYGAKDLADTAITTILSTTILNLLTGGLAGGNKAQQFENQQTTIENEQVLNNNEQVTQEQGKNTQNQSSEQINNTKQNSLLQEENSKKISEKIESKTYKNSENVKTFLESAVNNNFDIKSKEIETISKILDNRNLKGSFNSDVFKGDTNKSALYVNGEVILNPKADSKKGLYDLVIHETAHSMLDNNTELKNTILETLKTDSRYEQMYNDIASHYSEEYKNSDNFQKDVEEEMIADYLGENLSTEEFITKISEAQKTNNQSKVKQVIDNFIQKIKEFFTSRFGTGIKETDAEKYYWNKIENLFYDSYLNSENVSNENNKYSFAGVNSKSANYNTLAVAETLERSGKSQQEIYKKTGWYRGNENKWRYEIYDSNFEIKTNIEANKGYNLNSILLNADELYKAYPQLKDAEINFVNLPKDIAGGYSETYDSYIINNNLINNTMELKKTLLHEIQHNIQAIEDFSRGNSDNWQEIKTKVENKLASIDKEIDNINSKIGFEDYKNKLFNEYFGNDNFNSNEYFSKLEEFQNNSKYSEQIQRLKAQKKSLEENYKNIKNRSSDDLYQNTAGEQESFDVEKRLDMSLKERKAQLPFVKNKKTVYNIDNKMPYEFNGDKYELFLKEDIKNGKNGYDINVRNKESRITRDNKHISSSSRTEQDRYFYRQTMESQATNKGEDISNFKRNTSKNRGLENKSSSFSLPKNPDILINTKGRKIDISNLQETSQMRLNNYNRKYNKENITAYRGISENTGNNSAMYGLGLYTTLDKNYASKYGDVEIVDSKLLPENPLKFKTQNDFKMWEQDLASQLGIRYSELLGNDYGIEKYVKKLGYDGLMIGTGKDTDLISFKENKTNTSDAKYSQNTEGEWNTYLKETSRNNETRKALGEIKLPQKKEIKLPPKSINKEVEKKDSFSSTQEKYNENFAKQVDDYISGNMKSSDFINVSSTPKVLQDIGMPDNQIILKQSKLKTILKESNNPNDNLHGLSVETVKRIPEAISNPLNVLKSSTNENSIVVITDLADKFERPIIASIEMNYKGQIGNIEFLFNRLTSAYGKNNYDSFMQGEIAKGNLLYDIDEGIIKELPTSTRLQLPEGISSSVDTVDNVSTTNNIIPQNEKSMQGNNRQSLIAETGNPVIDKKSNEYKNLDSNIQETIQNVDKQKKNIENRINNLMDTNISNYDKRISDIDKRITEIENTEFGSSNDWIELQDELDVIEYEKDLLKQKKEELNENSDTLSNISLEKEKESKKERKQKHKELFQTVLVNKHYVIDKIFKDNKNYKGTVALDNFIGYQSSANTAIDGNIKKGSGQTNLKNEVIGKSINEILEPINKKKQLIEFSDYVYNLANIERVQQNKKIHDRTALQSKATAESYEKKYPYFKEIQKEVTNFFNNELQNTVDAGITKEETAQLIKEIYPNFASVYRKATDLTNLYDSGRITATALKKAVGSDKQILPINTAMAEYALSMRRKIALNKVLVELNNSLYNNKENEQNANTGFSINPENLLTGKDTVAGEETLQQLADGRYLATCYKNGEAIQFEIPENVYNLLNEQKTKNAIIESINGVTKVTSPLNNTFRTVVTTLNPAFTTRNVVKDFSTGIKNSKYGGVQYTVNYIRGVGDILTNTAIDIANKPLGILGKTIPNIGYTKEYINSGLGSNSRYDRNTGKLNNKYDRKLPQKAFDYTIGNVLNVIEYVNGQIEMAGRMSEFISALDSGKDIDIAKYEASEVTLNFKRGGEGSKTLSKLGATFFNTKVLAVEKIVKNVTGQNGWKGYSNLIVHSALVPGGLAILNQIICKAVDDDDYEELPDYIKDGYYLIPRGEGKFWRIPKDTISTVIGSSTRRFLDMYEGNFDASEGDLAEWIKVITDSLGVGNPGQDNIFAPIGQALDNKAWYDENIISDSQQKLNPEAQYDYRTNEVSKWTANQIAKLPKAVKETAKGLPGISQAYDILSSPKKSQYVVEQYLGGIGKLVLPMATPYAEQNYIEKEMSTNSTLKSKYPGKVYDLLDEISKEYNTYGTNEDKYQYLSEATKTMSGYYREIRELENDKNISNEMKKTKELAIRRELDNYAKGVLDDIENSMVSDGISQIGNSEYYKDSEGKTKKVDEEKSAKLPSKTFADYYNKVQVATKQKQNEKGNDKAKLNNTEKITILYNSKYSEEEKRDIYQNYIDKDDEIYNVISKLEDGETNIDEYLDYKMQEFKSDENTKSNIVGKKVSKGEGTAKSKTLNYINNSNMTDLEKAYIVETTYPGVLSNKQLKQLTDIVKSKITDKEELEEVLDKFKDLEKHKDDGKYHGK